MADLKISEVRTANPASALDGTEAFPLVQGAATAGGIISQILTYALADSSMAEKIQDVVGALASGGAGLTMTYNDGAGTWVLAVNVDDSTLEINSDTLRVKDGGIGFVKTTRPTHAGGWLFEAFLNGISTSGSTPTGPLALSTSSSGAGAVAGAQATTGADAFGVCFCSTGTTTTGRSGVFSGLTAIRFGSTAFRTRWRFQFPSLLDGTETGAFYALFIDNNTAAPVDGVYIYWDNAQTNFRARTRSNSTETDTDLGAAPAAATWYEAEAYVNADATSAWWNCFMSFATAAPESSPAVGSFLVCGLWPFSLCIDSKSAPALSLRDSRGAQGALRICDCYKLVEGRDRDL